MTSAMHSSIAETPALPVCCWACGSCGTVPWRARTLARELNPDDFRITDSHYGATLALRRCPTCDFIFAEGEELRNLTCLYEQLTDPEYEKSQDTRALQVKWLISQPVRSAPTQFLCSMLVPVQGCWLRKPVGKDWTQSGWNRVFWSRLPVPKMP